MKIIDAGHIYEVDSLDGGEPQRIVFVKREGENFPFNKGTHPGANCQEYTRVLINRSEYLYSQKPHPLTAIAIWAYKIALWSFEQRAANRHGRMLDIADVQELVCGVTCKKCGHIGCSGMCHPDQKAQEPTP